MDGAVKIYVGYVEGGLEERGDFRLALVRELLAEAVSALGNNDFCVGLSRSRQDFVEVHPVGGPKYMIWSDRLCKSGSLLQRLLQSARIERIVEGEAEVLRVIETYVERSREDFERAYT